MKSGGPCPVCGEVLEPVSRFQYAQDILNNAEITVDRSTPATADVPYESILKIEGLKCRLGHIFALNAEAFKVMVPCPNPRCRSSLEFVSVGQGKALRCEDYGRRCSLIIDPVPRLGEQNRDRIMKEVKRIGWGTSELKVKINTAEWFRSISHSLDKRSGTSKSMDGDRRERDRALEVKESSKGIIMNMIETLDNISRAMEDARRYQDVKEVERMLGGLEAIKKGAVSSLERKGIQVIFPEGDRFDPELHEAVGIVIDNGRPSDTVAKVELDGYMKDGVLIRPAKVIVSKHGKDEEETMDWDEEDWES